MLSLELRNRCIRAVLKSLGVVAVASPVVVAIAGCAWFTVGIPDYVGQFREREALSFLDGRPSKPAFQRWLGHGSMRWSVVVAPSRENAEADAVVFDRRSWFCEDIGDELVVHFDRADQFKSLSIKPYTDGC